MTTTRLKTRSNSAFRLIYHLVLVTKFRNKSLTSEMIDRLKEIFRETLHKWDCELVEFNGEGDPIHILFEAIPSIELSRLVNNLKTVSSRLMRKEYEQHLKRKSWHKLPKQSLVDEEKTYYSLDAGEVLPANIIDCL